MEEIRRQWLETVERYRLSAKRPDDESYWCRRLDTVSADELHAIHSEKLRVAVGYVYEAIPFYRRKFDRIGLEPGDIRSVDDLARIPVTTKQEMMQPEAKGRPAKADYTAVDDETWKERGWQLFATSGSTAEPRVFRYTGFDRAVWSWTNARAMWAMGFRPGRDVALLAFGYGPHVWLWGVHYGLNLMGIPIVSAGGLDSRTRVRFIERYRPTILACTPSYALYLGGLMREMGLDPAQSSVRFLFVAGEPGYGVPATRRRLEELWKAEVAEFYGCTEAAPSAGGYTCAAAMARKQGPAETHLMADTHIWETVDPSTLAPVPAGRRGLSLVTNLCSEASPQLRFLVGDFTTLALDTCDCGRTHPRAIGGFIGRADDMLNIRGVTIFPSAIEDAVRRVPGSGEEFQIVLSRERELDRIKVVVEPRPELASQSHPELARRVESEIVASCELRMEVEVVPHGTLPRTEFKAKRVKDLRAGPY